MAFAILGTPVPAFFDSSGAPLAAGTITTLNPSNDAVKASYPTAADADASTNGTSGDITLDARGEPTSTQYWGKDNEDYKVVIKDSAAATVLTMDKIRMPTHNRRSTVTFTSTDATPTIAESNSFITAGTTAITDFDDGAVGDTIEILAASSITITHGTPVSLLGSANFAMVAGDTLTLHMFNDQVWEEVARTTATATLTAGTGITTGSGTIYKSSVTRIGEIITTRILIDLTGLDSNVLDDIIGAPGGTANCHFGQITAAKSGTILGGKMKCLEAPTGGEPDIDLYGATVGTGAEDTDIEDLDELLLLAGGADWTIDMYKSITAVPRANDYLYLAGGGGTTDDTYTAGKFLIELYGY